MDILSSYSVCRISSFSSSDVVDAYRFKPVFLKLWFGSTWGWGPLTGHLQGQNYLHNNTKTLFASSTLSSIQSSFSRSYIACSDIVSVMAVGMCACVFVFPKFLSFSVNHGKH